MHIGNLCASRDNLILLPWSNRRPELFSNLSSIGRKAFPREHIIGAVLGRTFRAGRLKVWRNTMMDLTATGMGLMMTAVAVAIAGLMLDATLSMMCRALRTPALGEPFEPADIHLR